ncbi:MFS transporter [Paenibacillus sp. MCAF9]|uniref:MFS transporter n=1 Tax=unclassified Paenibacillus TaxID=185978 RepID=UPI003F991849
MKTLFSNRVYLLVTASDLLQNIGTWIRNIALLFFVLEKSNNDPVAVSMLTVIEYFPIFAVALVGGALVDRWNPKKTMIIADLLSIVSILLIIGVLDLGFWPAIYIATFVSTIITQFSQPSSIKLIKRYVEPQHVGAAVGLTQSMNSIFMIVGPVIGTAIYVNFGLKVSLYSLLILFALSASFLSFLPKQTREEKKENSSVLKEIKEGMIYLRQNRILVVIAVWFAIDGLSWGLIQPLDVFILTERLQLPKENLQWFSMLYGVGMLAGGLIAASIGNRFETRKIFTVVIIVTATGVLVQALSTYVWLTASFHLLVGLFYTVLQVLLNMLFIKSVQDEYVGRVNGVMVPVFIGFMLIGTFCSGFLKEATSLIFVYGTSSFVLLLTLPIIARLKPKHFSKMKH